MQTLHGVEFAIFWLNRNTTSLTALVISALAFLIAFFCCFWYSLKSFAVDDILKNEVILKKIIQFFISNEIMNQNLDLGEFKETAIIKKLKKSKSKENLQSVEKRNQR